MKNQFMKKCIAMMLAGALILGEAGTWTASAAEISDNAAESAETAEEEISETADAADVMVESVETESSGGDSVDSEDSEAVTAESKTASVDDMVESEAVAMDDTVESEAASMDETDEAEKQVQVDVSTQDTDEEEADPEIYTELMDYIDATSALLTEYPCDYDGTLDIDIDSGEITDQNGETIDAMDDALEEAVDSDDADEAAEALEENGYVVLDVDDTTVSVEDPYQTMRLIVTSEDGLSSSYGAEAVISYEDEYILQYSSTEDTINAYTALAADTDVEELYIDVVVTAYETEDEEEEVSSYALTDADGEDTHLSWGVETMGLDVMQEKLEAADTEESTEDDLEEVVVAVIDTGVNYENIYLDGRVLSEDGYDCYNVDDDAMDDSGHGTHVAGVVVDGTSDNVMVLPVKVLDSRGSGTLSSLKNGIRYALDYGVDVINLSLGLEDNAGTASYLESLFREAQASGCMIVCAAGNKSTDVAYCYPAHSDLTLAVSALTTSLSLASYSNYGNGIDFSAPGSTVKSAYYTSSTSTATMSGTSMAAPHVTAAIALLKTWDSTISNDEIEDLLEDYSVDLGDEGKDSSYGFGYIYLGNFDVSQEVDAQDVESESEAIDLADTEVSLYAYTYTYNGNAKKPPVTVTYNGETLTKNTDYTVVYTDNVNAGTALVTITGKGNYTGSVEKEFTIEKASPKLTVTAESYSLVPGDAEAIEVSYKGNGTISYTSEDDSIAAVSADGVVTAESEGAVIITVTVAKTDNYESESASFGLVVGDVLLSECKVTLSETEYTYDGTAHTPAVIVQYGSVSLTEGSDFEVEYSNNTNAGTATVTVKGLNNCTGTVETTFVIEKAEQTLYVFVDNENICVGDTEMIEAESDGDGTISYVSDNPDVVEVDDQGNFTGIAAGAAVLTVVAEASDNYDASSEQTVTIIVSRNSQTVTVKAGSSSIKAGETTTVTATTTGDGSISYKSSDPSIATVSSAGKVTGVGVGTVTITATVKATTGYNAASSTVKIKVGLSAPTISSVVQSGSNVTVKWGKVIGAGGYYVYRSTSSNSVGSKVATITSGSTVSWKDTSSKSNGKTYYYRVYAFSGSTKSSASSYKSVKYMKGTVSSLTNNSSGITVKWSKVSGASGYYVYRKESGASSYIEVKTITSASTVSYTDKAVKSKNGTTYTYYVQPYNSTSKGAYATKKTVRLTGTSLSSVKNNAAKKMTVKWSKKSSVTGYQIQYSRSSSFSSGNKTVTVSGSSKKSATISGLTRGKTYYVRIRTYKTVNGTKYYSAWSAKKKVKIS